jgi:hypothetical protein
MNVARTAADVIVVNAHPSLTMRHTKATAKNAPAAIMVVREVLGHASLEPLGTLNSKCGLGDGPDRFASTDGAANGTACRGASPRGLVPQGLELVPLDRDGCRRQRGGRGQMAREVKTDLRVVFAARIEKVPTDSGSSSRSASAVAYGHGHDTAPASPRGSVICSTRSPQRRLAPSLTASSSRSPTTMARGWRLAKAT